MFERRILEVYRYCNVRSFPIDCDDVIHKLGYQIVTYQSLANGSRNKLIELMQVSNDAFIIRRKRTVYVNANADRRRQRFSKCHEIGHIAIPTNDEDEADTFASEILAPLPVVARYGFDCDTICRIFDVSVAMANRIISESKGKVVSDPEGILDYFKKCEAEDAKKRYEIRAKRYRRRAIPITEVDELRLARHDLELFLY